MAEYRIATNFRKEVDKLLEQIATFAYDNGYCGHSAASDFLNELNKTLEKVTSAPLQYSSEWGHPQRRTFFDCKSQYTVILAVSPHDAQGNEDINDVLYSDIYPSKSIKGNTFSPDTQYFDANELLKD